MRMRALAIAPLVMMTAACAAVRAPEARHDSQPGAVARQKITALFADHCDRFACDSFTYANKTIHATGIRIAPDPSVTADHPSATLTIRDLRIVLAADPTPATDLRPIEIDIDEPTLRRPEALRGSTPPTPTEAYLGTFMINVLDDMSQAQWTKVFDLGPQWASPTPEMRAGVDKEFGALQAVKVHLLRIELPP